MILNKILYIKEHVNKKCKKFFSFLSKEIEEVRNNNSKKWRKEIEILKNKENQKDVDINELNYIIKKEKRRKIKELKKENDEKKDNIKEDTLNIFDISNNNKIENVNLKKKDLFEFDEYINYYDKWNLQKINYKNTKTSEMKTVAIENNIQNNKDIYNIKNYYDYFENTENLENLKKQNNYNKLFSEDDPRLLWDVQNDYFFANDDIYFFNNFNDSNYSQFLDTLNYNENFYFSYLNKRKPIKFLSKDQIIEILEKNSEYLFRKDNQSEEKKKLSSSYDNENSYMNYNLNDSINYNTKNRMNDYKNEKIIFFNENKILERIIEFDYDNEKNKKNDKNYEFYLNMLNRIEFISLSFKPKECVFILSFFYFYNFLPFEILNKFIQNFLSHLHFLNIQQVLILLKIYSTWKNNYEDFLHLLLVYFFNLKMDLPNEQMRNIEEIDNKLLIKKKENHLISNIKNDIFFLKMCLKNKIRINNSLMLFHCKNNLPFYDKNELLLLFQCFFFLSDKKNNDLLYKTIKISPFLLRNYEIINDINELRTFLCNEKNYPKVKLNFKELEIILASLNNMNSVEFYEYLKLFLINDYYYNNDIIKKIEKEIYKCKYNNNHNNHLLYINIEIMNFLIFYNIITNLKKYVLFPFFNKNDLFELLKNVKLSENKIEIHKDNIKFDCLIKMDISQKGENIYEKEKNQNNYSDKQEKYNINDLVKFSGEDIKNIFICENENLNKFLYHYEKTTIKKIKLDLIVDTICFINEYSIFFKNILDINKKVNEDILFVLYFFYLKILTIMNSLKNNDKQIILYHYSRIIPSYCIKEDSDSDILFGDKLKKKEKKRMFFFLYYNIFNQDVKDNSPSSKFINSSNNTNMFYKNRYFLKNSIFNTLLLIFHKFFDSMNVSFDANIFFKNIKNIILSISLYIYKFGNVINYYDYSLKNYLLLCSDNYNEKNSNCIWNISQETSNILLKLMNNIISFFYIFKENFNNNNLNDEEVVHLINSLSFFAVSLQFYENIENKTRNDKNLCSFQKYSKKKDEEKIVEFYNNILYFFIKELEKIDISELNEINKLITFETLSRIFVLNSLNDISSKEVILLLNKLMNYIVDNEMYINKENYYLIIFSYENLKGNYHNLKSNDFFDIKIYEQLEHMLASKGMKKY
ncbi:conserved Plasmodium protein, unknown function [Plasmodium relictum]|uniref:Uncharacterized protein n=1 Tax=Plasmodium relictum TaxID=85471 RepID=A0A1J1H4L3_PLARL|nr:conserved Plasmodium protein, unknown function [Plasmodium relictum]CRG99498.1 conserved Plasmodium protein, unknown function [Plasmodium relictum]